MNTFISKSAVIGNNVKIMHGAYVGENVIIEDDVIIYPYAVVGLNAQSKENIFDCSKKVVIKKGTVIREFVTIHHPTIENKTEVGNNCYLMAGSHVSHDTIISDNVVLCNNVALGGHTFIGEGTTIGLNTSVHQFSKIGRYCMISANAFFKGESIDGLTWIGSKARPVKINYYALNKFLKNNPKEYKAIEEIGQNFLRGLK